jgi:hypothetical protein
MIPAGMKRSHLNTDTMIHCKQPFGTRHDLMLKGSHEFLGAVMSYLLCLMQDIHKSLSAPRDAIA